MRLMPLNAVAVLILGSLLFCMPGCGGGDNETPATSNASGAQNPDKKDRRLRIAFVTNQVASFWDIAAAGARDAAREFNVDVEVKFPSEASVNIQKQVVEDLLTSGIDGLAISPLDAENQVDQLNAWARQVPMICHDSDSPKSDRLAFIGVDNYAAGRAIGKMIKKAMPDGGKLVICVGRLQQDNARKRRQGVIDELLDRSVDDTRFDEVEQEISGNGYTIVATITDGGEQQVALQKAEDAINAWPDIKCFVGLFVYNPVACLNAIKKAGRNDILVAGFDEADETLAGVRAGSVIGTCSQNPYQYGYRSVEVLAKIIRGEDAGIPDSKYLPVTAIEVTKDNVDSFEAELKARLGSQ